MIRKMMIAGLLGAVALPVIAQVPVAPVAPMHPMADKVVTRAEVQAKVQSHFARVDTNRDGYVTTEEAAAVRAARMAKHAGGMKANRAMRDPNAAFDRLDTNRDGMINRDEFAKAHEMRVEKRVVMNHGAPGQPGAMRMRMHHGGGMGGLMGGGMMKMADANKDGRVSLQEATAGALQHFDMMDTNRDGRITPEERRAGRMMMKQMRKAG